MDQGNDPLVPSGVKARDGLVPQGDCTPEHCSVARWIRCRRARPERALRALETLTRAALRGYGSAVAVDRAVQSVVRASADLRDGEGCADPLLVGWVHRHARGYVRALHSRVAGGARAWDATPGWDWDELSRVAHAAAVSWARRRGLDESTAADLAQEALLRIRGRDVRRPRQWFRFVFGSLAGRAARGRSDLPLASRLERPDGADLDAIERSRDEDPWRRAAGADVVAVADRLPPPYREIARLQYVHGRSREELIAWLRRWRPVGVDACRKAIRTTHVLLRHVGRGVRPESAWPRRYDARSNPWCATAPPPFATEGFATDAVPPRTGTGL